MPSSAIPSSSWSHNRPEYLISRLRLAASGDFNGDAKLNALRELKNQIIGNRTKKLSYIKLGAVPSVVEILSSAVYDSSGDVNSLLVQSSAVIGSFACGVDAGVKAVLDAGAFPHLMILISHHNVKVVDAAARSLRMIYQSKLAPKYDFLHGKNLEFILSLLNTENENVTGLGASIITHSCQTKIEQKALSDAGVLKKLVSLLGGSLSQRDASLESLASLIKENPEVVSKFVGPESGRAMNAVTELTKDKYPRTRLFACMCLIGVKSTSPSSLQGAGIKMKIIMILLELLDDPGEVGDEAGFALSSFISDSEDLQKLAYEANVVDKLCEYLQNCLLQTRRYQGVLLALAGLSSKLECCRSKIFSHKAYNLMIDALSHDRPEVRVAACHCLKSLSRSVQHLSAGHFMTEMIIKAKLSFISLPSLSLSVYIYIYIFMEVFTVNPDIIESPQLMVAPSASPDHSISDQSPPSPTKHEIQSQPSLRSEEYRQLFRLPPDEVLIQDFNCALQESFILQGHMYLFVHHICFYSNLFGFETKKIIPFEVISSVRRAKTAGLFPTAIEITALGKKFFFSSFLSRDEALKLIEDGWLQHGNGANPITDQQEAISAISTQDNDNFAGEQSISDKAALNGLESTQRNKDVAEDNDTSCDTEAEIVSTSSRFQNNLEEDVDVINNGCSRVKSMWEPEDVDAPKVPECYTLVAEAKFPLKVDEFFSVFFSDDALGFLESYHKKCGDKELRCSPWRPHEKYGYVRDISFKHPIKIYLGARCASPRVIQKLGLYRNSHLIIETTQEISDVPYGDYFCVEVLWDVEKNGDGCTLRIYLNVVFSKNTMWKGKIIQSTIDECRDAYAIWIAHAHDLLKQMNLEKEGRNAANSIAASQSPLERQEVIAENIEMPNVPSDLSQLDSGRINQDSIQVQESFGHGDSVSSFFRGSIVKVGSYFKAQSQFPSVVVIIVAAVFLLMQISIIVLLAKPQQIHVVPQANYLSSMNSRSIDGAETMTLLDKQISHLKDEMRIIEILLEKMQLQQVLLKAQLQDLSVLRERMTTQ